MYAWHNHAPASAGSTAIMPLLGVIAGEFAHAIAQIWPAPHRSFFEASAERRHLTCLILTVCEHLRGPAFSNTPELAHALSGTSMKELIRRFLPEAPFGLSRALQRLGELAWTRAEYTALIELLGDPGAAKIRRHAEIIEPTLVATLGVLPPELRMCRIPLLCKRPEHARLIAEAFAATKLVRSPTAMSQVCERWRRAENLEGLFSMAKEDITPSCFMPSPLEPHPMLLYLGTEEALQDAGRRFRNCIGAYALRAADGQTAVYEYLGEHPAIVSIGRDPLWRWRLDEVRLEGNESFPKEARPALLALLASLGVAFRRGGYSLSSTLEWAATDPDRACVDWDETEVFGS